MSKPNYDIKVVLSPRGSQRRVVALKEVQIPDCWKVYEALRAIAKCKALEDALTEHGFSRVGFGAAAEQVLECWHVAHDLRLNLAGDIGER